MPSRLPNPQLLRRIATAALIPVSVAALWAARQPLAELLTAIKDREAIVRYLQSYGAWGPLLLALIIGLQVLVAAIPGHVFMVAGGYLYGFTGGFAITYLSTVVASQMTFALARWAGRPLVNRLVESAVLDRWRMRADRQGIPFFVLSFVLPIFPNDMMCYVAGLNSISPARFLVANAIGRLPVAVLMTLIGSHGLKLSPGAWAFVVVAGLGLFLAWRHCNRDIERRCLPPLAEA